MCIMLFMCFQTPLSKILHLIPRPAAALSMAIVRVWRGARALAVIYHPLGHPEKSDLMPLAWL